MAITSYKAVVGYYNGAGTPSIITAVTGQLADGWLPIGAPILTDSYGQCTQMMAKTDATPAISTSDYTVVTAANPQPPDATWDAQGEPLWVDTTTYLQAYTKGGAYLQGTVPVSRGGTGATTTLAAAANLQVFAIPNNLSEITDRSAAWLNLRPVGPLPLGADPVGDYDATTMRWVKTYVDSGGGGGGASMNGVMNYGVGQITLWHSRAFIPSYAVVADGQLLSRTDYPELWAHAQMHSPVTDAEWLGAYQRRGKFSTGNGTTTFRVPDLNGVQSASAAGLFGRGDGGGAFIPGYVNVSGLPNITAGMNFHGAQSNASGATVLASTSGAIYTASAQSNAGGTSVIPGVGSWGSALLDASRSHAVYGRNTTEVVPNAFVGVWIIRANGGFVAANTSWTVTNADATSPPAATVVLGGAVVSDYKIGTTSTYRATLQSYGTIGGTTAQRGARITTTGGANFNFTDAGRIVLPSGGGFSSAGDFLGVDTKTFYTKTIIANPGESIAVAGAEQNEIVMSNTTVHVPGNYVNTIRGTWYSGVWRIGGVRGGTTLLDRVQITVENGGGSNASYLFGSDGVAQAQEWRNVSDERIKDNITRVSDPLVKMRNIKGVSWTLKTNGSFGFGFIAQDVEKDFPDAVGLTMDMTMADGTVVKSVKSVNTPGVAAALHHEAILALMDKVEALEALLKSGK